MCSFLWQKIIFLGIGTTILVIGGLLSVLWPIIFNNQLQKQLVLSDGSKSFNLWKETPIPMFIDFYMFNWTNPEESLNKHELPHFVEIGPYVFREEHQKVNMDWNNNGTVTFKQIRKWTFLPELSVGLLSDKITNVNVIAMTIGSMVKKMVPKYFFPFVNDALKLENKVYVTRTVGELLFDGYRDVFLEIVKKLRPILKIDLPMDKFGWFYGRNMSADYDGVFNMMTGASTLQNLGVLQKWNNQRKTKFFPGECGVVGGTTGELWPINSASNSKATIFATDLCSKLDTEWVGTTDIHGATGSVFRGTEGTLNNNSRCYCVGGECHPTGVREISTCRYGAPAFISFPHFYLADPSYRDIVTGLLPDPAKHTFDITLHKITAVPLSVNARLQINILVDKIPGIKFYEKLPKAFMPMIWFNERALITSELASQLSSLEIYSWFEPGFFCITGLGMLMLFVGLFLWSNRRWKKSTHDPLLEENSTN